MNTAVNINTRTRIESIDILRGIVMIIMALDHVRDYFHLDSFLFSPTDLKHTTPVLFFTRWITHLCAPTFIFLAGTSAYFIAKKKTAKYASFFLLTRGLWLIVLQLTLIRFAWQFDPLFHYNGMTIISTIGFCMIFLSLLIHLNLKTILIIGLVLVLGHNTLDSISFEYKTVSDIFWTFLHGQNTYDLGNGYFFNFKYPIIPWIGVMALGYCLGSIYEEGFSFEKRKKVLLGIGTACVVVFIVLRFINIYGDPIPWSVQPTVAGTVMSFFNLAKYPPSLLFCLITLGISLLLLAILEGRKTQVILFGKVSLFYYVMHIFVIHILAVIVVFACGYSWETMIFKGEVAKGSPELLKENFGFGLSEVYLIWISVILFLYPLCDWWSHVKAKHKEKWWSSYV